MIQRKTGNASKEGGKVLLETQTQTLWKALRRVLVLDSVNDPFRGLSNTFVDILSEAMGF